mmetsp:Transcript_149768/g.479914  ORF Transcript_149768/g.479914 Transcript_149768/m.479914 type:complete len:140 (+) Transcript_149768:96-515(+)
MWASARAVWRTMGSTCFWTGRTNRSPSPHSSLRLQNCIMADLSFDAGVCSRGLEDNGSYVFLDPEVNSLAVAAHFASSVDLRRGRPLERPSCGGGTELAWSTCGQRNIVMHVVGREVCAGTDSGIFLVRRRILQSLICS